MFDTRNADRRGQYALWKDSISVIFEVTDGQPVDRDGYEARLDSALIENTMISRVTSGHQQFDRDALRSYRDGLDSVMFQVFTRGGVRKSDEAGCLAPRYALIGFDLTQPVSNINSEFDLISIIFPRAELSARGVQPSSIHLKVLEGTSGLAALTSHMILDLQKNLTSMDVQEAAFSTRAAIDLIAECYSGEVRRDGGAQAHRNALLLRAREIIQSRIAASETVDTASLLDALPCSRATLYRSFEPFGGVASFIRLVKLRRALRAIARPSAEAGTRKLGEIAAQCGFHSDAHFSRSFRKEFGMSPSEARQVFEAHGSLADMSSTNAPTDRRYELWLRSISQ